MAGLLDEVVQAGLERIVQVPRHVLDGEKTFEHVRGLLVRREMQRGSRRARWASGEAE